MKKQIDKVIKRAQKVIDLSKRTDKKPKTDEKPSRLLTDKERAKKNLEKSVKDFRPDFQQKQDMPRPGYKPSGDSSKIFSGTMTVTHKWSEPEINELVEKHGYDSSKLTDDERQSIAEHLVWNLEDIGEKTSYNDSIDDLLADVIQTSKAGEN